MVPPAIGYGAAIMDQMTPPSATAGPAAELNALPVLAGIAAGGGSAEALQATPHLLVNAPMTLARLGLLDKINGSLSPQYDLLELFAFVRPAAFLVPTRGALANALEIHALDIQPPDNSNHGADAEAGLLRGIAAALLRELASDNYAFRRGAVAAARIMAQAAWPWAPLILKSLGAEKPSGKAEAMEMPAEWRDGAWRHGRGESAVTEEDALCRLGQMLGEGAETRPTQRDYTAACCAAFQSGAGRDGGKGKSAAVSLLEAGTGIGKTLGYIAPASLWAEQNGGTVWLSTYTRNLQRQLEQELSRLYPDPAERARRAVVRKGRENYLCLLNLEESLVRAGQRSPGRSQEILLGLILRWLPYSRDGDMAGGDFPRWLISGAGAGTGLLMDLTDRRGECIHSACAHFKRCFVERALRKSRSAHLVVANHALVLTSLARGGDATLMPRRLVFDEGHHLFEAADSAFSLAISGREGAMMRRWILGAERSAAGRRGGRARGLAARLGELAAEDRKASELLDAAINAAGCLPGPGWHSRVQKAQPRGQGENFLMALRGQVLAEAPPGRHSLEVAAEAPGADLRAAAIEFAEILGDLTRATEGLARRLQALQDENEQSEGQEGAPPDARAAAAIRGLVQRAATLAAWQNMLVCLTGDAPPALAVPRAPEAETTAADAYVDWLAIHRSDGRETDYGLHRHWLDPTIPLAEKVLEPADGVIVTSATLRDEAQATEEEDGWRNAESRVGGHHLVQPPRRAGFDSPFDYAAQTRVFVVTDVDKRSLADVSAAYAALFRASKGGALGIFTAIERLKAVYREIVPAMAKAELLLLAQHVDPMDTGTLVDIFRAEEQACLLGTDAIRDGIDVPGRSLRLIVFDRVPWPRPTILHKARRAHFGGRGYDESLTRLRLKQAYGRLIRGKDDHGVFIMLDVATPSRLLSAFPPGVSVERLPLDQVIGKTREFLL